MILDFIDISPIERIPYKTFGIAPKGIFSSNGYFNASIWDDKVYGVVGAISGVDNTQVNPITITYDVGDLATKTVSNANTFTIDLSTSINPGTGETYNNTDIQVANVFHGYDGKGYIYIEGQHSYTSADPTTYSSFKVLMKIGATHELIDWDYISVPSKHDQTLVQRRMCLHSDGNFYAVDYDSANDIAYLFQSSDGYNFTEAATYSEEFSIYNCFSYKNDLYIGGSTCKKLDSSYTEVKSGGNVKRGMGPEQVYEVFDSDDYNNWLDPAIFTDVNEVIIIDISGAPYIHGDMILNEGATTSIPEKIVFSYKIDDDPNDNFDAGENLFEETFELGVDDIVEDGKYFFFIPQSSTITNGRIYIGAYGAKPIIENYEINTTTERTLNLDRVNSELSTPEDLYNIRFDPFGNFKLVNDIDLTDFQQTTDWYSAASEFRSWISTNPLQVGHFPPIHSFHNFQDYQEDVGPSIDANGFSIKNMTFKDIALDDVGLFRNFTPAREGWNNTKVLINDLTLENFDIQGNNSVSTLMGEVSATEREILPSVEILNVEVKASTVNSNGIAGGLIGEINDSSYTSNYSSFEMLIEKTAVNCDVTGDSNTGGILGAGVCDIKNCFARGTLTDPNNVAGLVGLWYTDDYTGDKKISKSYFAGTLVGTTNVRPLINTSKEGYLERCYYDSEIIGTDITQTLPGENSRLTSEMTYPFVEEEVSKVINYNETLNADFTTGELIHVEPVNDALQLKTQAPAPTCDFGVDFPLWDWITSVHITNQNGTVLLDSQTPNAIDQGHIDNTDQIIECSAGDVLTISVGVASDDDYVRSLSWGHNINGNLVTVADLHEAVPPYTHTYTWTVPNVSGMYVASWWERHNGYQGPCSVDRYGTRQDFTLLIDSVVGFYPSGERTLPEHEIGKIKQINSSAISWVEELNGETAEIEVSVDGGETWQVMTNGTDIPNLVKDYTYIITRQKLSTTNPAATPRFLEFGYEIDAVFIERPAYTEWDMENVWAIKENENDGYPVFGITQTTDNTTGGSNEIYSGGMDVGVYTVYRRWRR